MADICGTAEEKASAARRQPVFRQVPMHTAGIA
jgi:hypothetical protein